MQAGPFLQQNRTRLERRQVTSEHKRLGIKNKKTLSGLDVFEIHTTDIPSFWEHPWSLLYDLPHKHIHN